MSYVELLNKATVIDGIAATEGRDSQGEVLKLSGCDISQMTTKGFYNDNHGTGFLNTLGRITHAKKIYKQEDCEDDRQRMFWKQAGKPYLYVKGYLFDDSDHPNAKAVGAIMKEFQKMGTPLDVKYSVEGKVLDRAPYDRSILAQSMVRNVALTLVPANGETAASVAGRINKSMDLIKSEAGQAVAVCVERLVKSIESGAQPQNRWDIPTEEERAEALLKKIVELTSLIKAKNTSRPVAWNSKPSFSDLHVSEDGKYTISRRSHRAGDRGDRKTMQFFDVVHYPEGQANTKNYQDLGSKYSLKDAKAHVEAHASGSLKKMTSPGYGGGGAPAQSTGGAALVSKDPRRKALTEILKTVIASNPGVSLSKALELVLAGFRKRFS